MRSEDREMFEDYSDEKLVAMASDGDDLAEEMLIRRYLGLLDAKSHIYYIAGADRDDVRQEGMIGLVRAIRTFDADKSVSFHAYANICINRQIFNAIKSASRDKHRPLNEYEPLDETIVAGDRYEYDKADLLDDLLAGKSKSILSRMEQEVLDLYLQGKSYRIIAEEMNKDTKAIDNCMQRIRKKIHEALLIS